MLPVDATMAALMASAVRAPRVYVACQLPVLTNATTGTIDASKLGSKLILDQVESIRMEQILEPGSDTADIVIDNTSGGYSPINPATNFARYFFPGSVDNKYQVYLGLESEGTEEVLPKGTFVSSTTSQTSQTGVNTLTLSTLDQFSLFSGNVYTQIPPKLYGNQESVNFNPNYALKNPSGDLKYYYCDAVNWMQVTTTNGLLASDFIQVQVYSSSYQSGTSPIPNSGQYAYQVDYNNGGINFTSAQAPTDIISVDARPQAINPMLALQHLFQDFGFFSEAFMKFDNPGILIPVMEIARDRSILDVAKDVCYATSPRGIQWQLYFDENGFLNFCEPNIDGPPAVTLTDERDILRITPEYTSKDIANVVRASATLNNGTVNQPLVSVSYDVNSISVFGQKPTYDIPYQMLATVPMMDPGTAMAFMNSMTMNALAIRSTPSINVEVEILPNPVLQVGDPVQIIENKTGLNKYFYINQISTDIQGSQYKQTLRLTQLKANIDFLMGLQANIGIPSATNPNAIQTQSGMISSVQMQNQTDTVATTLVYNGEPAIDNSFNTVPFYWNGTNLTINVGLAAPASGETFYIWRWMYLSEDVYLPSSSPPTVVSGDGSVANVWGSSQGYQAYINHWYGAGSASALSAPYDVTNNVDSPRSRRFFWPLLRCSDWLSNDGISGYTAATTLSSTYTQGPGATNPTIYGALRIGQNNYFFNATSGFSGQPIYNSSFFQNTLQASSTILYGMDFGPSLSATVCYGIHRKVTPGFLNIFVATTAGTMQFKRIPFYFRPYT